MTQTTVQGTGPNGSRGWAPPPSEPTDLSADELAKWRDATRRVREIGEREGWTRTAAAERADIPLPTFSAWLDGTYTGSFPAQSARVTKWLDAYDSARDLAALVPTAPGWIATPTATEVMATLSMCQLMPDIAVVTLGSGMGKTMTARHYAASKPSAHLVTMRPTTGTVASMLQEIAATLDVTERNRHRLDRVIGQRLRRNGRQTLLIVDEAQNLADQAVDQLRWLHDEFGVGLALLGNNELYTRFGRGEPKEGYGQIHRRIGRRLVRLRPTDGDIDAVIKGWRVEDEDVAKLLRAAARKAGALGQVAKTMTLAGILAAGDGRPLDAGHVRAAWTNRGAGEAH